jgi:hypothetical protein
VARDAAGGVGGAQESGVSAVEASAYGPYTTNAGKNAHERVQRVRQPGVTEAKMWGAYEKVSVTRMTAAEGTR